MFFPICFLNTRGQLLINFNSQKIVYVCQLNLIQLQHALLCFVDFLLIKHI